MSYFNRNISIKINNRAFKCFQIDGLSLNNRYLGTFGKVQYRKSRNGIDTYGKTIFRKKKGIIERSNVVDAMDSHQIIVSRYVSAKAIVVSKD